MVIQLLDMIHSYIIGPLLTPSYGNSRYVLNFIDDFSRYCWVYFLKQKSEVFETFNVFKSLVENMSANKIKVLTTENGKEYVNKKLKQLCNDSGIHMHHYVPYTPQHNGVAERKKKALKNIETCMMEEKDLSPNILVESINCD